jgi:carboxymethylenebutenolidase
MRGVCDALAAEGLPRHLSGPVLAICSRASSMTDQTKAEWGQALELMNRFDVDAGLLDIQATIDAVRALPECDGKVGAVGYCLGGKLAFLTATRTDADALRFLLRGRARTAARLRSRA